MPHVEPAVTQSELHLGRKLQQAQKIGNGGALFAYAVAEPLLCEIILLNKFFESKGNLNGVKVFALNVLNESHLGQLTVVGSAHIGGHSVKTRELSSTEAAFTRDNLVGIVADAAKGEWLDYAQFPNRHGKLFESLLVEKRARLVGVRRN